MEYEIVIVADEYDWHYLTSINAIAYEDLQKLKPLLSAIKANKVQYNFNTTGEIEEIYETYPDFVDEIDLLNNLVPGNGNGIKSIVSVYYYPNSHKTIVF